MIAKWARYAGTARMNGKPLRLLLCLLLLPASSRANPHLRVDVPRALESVEIDALFSEWDSAPWHYLAPGAPYVSTEANSQLQDDGPIEPPDTPLTAADLSGRFSLQWNPDGLYLAARITDNIHDTSGAEPWQWYVKDAVTLFLDVPFDGDGPAWITGDHAFSFVADPALPPGGRWWRHGDGQGHREMPPPDSVTLAVRLTEKGYDLEAAVPLELLTDLTPAWHPPLLDRTVGFALIVTDPDGGPRPFGGQLIYGGESDDDGRWSQLRFCAADSVLPPRIVISPEEAAFEAKLQVDRQRVSPLFMSSTDSTGLQLRLASEYFQIYLEDKPSKRATRSLSMAITLWGNAAATDSIRASLQWISNEEDVWDVVVPGLRQAFYLDGRLQEAIALLDERERRVIPLKSRSALLFALAEYWRGAGEQRKARQAFARIALWRASPWHVQQSVRHL